MCCQSGCRSLRLSSELITVVSQCGLNNFSNIAACCFFPGQLKINPWTRIIPPQELLCSESYQVSRSQQHDNCLYGGRSESCSQESITSRKGSKSTRHSDNGAFSFISLFSS